MEDYGATLEDTEERQEQYLILTLNQNLYLRNMGAV